METLGINENEERELIEKSNLKKISNQSAPPLIYTEKYVLNEIPLKAKLEKKMDDLNIKIANSSCVEMINIGFNFFIKNFLTNLEKIASMERNSETLQGFTQSTETIVKK